MSLISESTQAGKESLEMRRAQSEAFVGGLAVDGNNGTRILPTVMVDLEKPMDANTVRACLVEVLQDIQEASGLE